jgi:hypothetical protein
MTGRSRIPLVFLELVSPGLVAGTPRAMRRASTLFSLEQPGWHIGVIEGLDSGTSECDSM